MAVLSRIETYRGIPQGSLRVQVLPIAPDLQQVRESLSGLPEKTPDYPTMKGVNLVQRASDRPKNECCVEFIFPGGSPSLSDVLLGGENVGSEPWAIACYFDLAGNLTHVGRVIQGGQILSKWGVRGNVYEHKAELVPDHYGNMIIYFRQS